MRLSARFCEVFRARFQGCFCMAGIASAERPRRRARWRTRGAAVKVLDKPHVDQTMHRPLPGLLSPLAEDERERIHKRASEGRRAAIARGVHMGRKRKLTEHQRRVALQRMQAGESGRAIARDMGWPTRLSTAWPGKPAAKCLTCDYVVDREGQPAQVDLPHADSPSSVRARPPQSLRMICVNSLGVLNMG